MDLTNAKTVREVLKKYHLWAKYTFGQNFLVDRQVLDVIIGNADLSSSDVVLEIGPGLGVLTRELCERAKKVIACEIDENMIEILEDTLSDFDNFEVHNISALQYKPEVKSYKVVANLPYNITGHFLKHMLEEVPYKPESLVLMVQKEVAEKMCAKDGKMNLVSLGVQVFGEAQIIEFVSPLSFLPPPKVESAIVRIDVFDKPAIDCTVKEFFCLVRHCFSQKRKKVRATLRNYVKIDVEKLQQLEVQFDLDKRPQEFSIVSWNKICNCILGVVE